MTFTKGGIPWNKGTKGVQVAWNKGTKMPQTSGENNPFYGKHHTEETKRKISLANIGRLGSNKGKHLSEETKQKIREARLGTKHSEESKKKMSLILIGKPSRNKGKIYTLERITELFWKRVNKTETCWIWIAALDGKGYGRATYQKKLVQAHRLAWFLTYGEWPEKLLCHKCDNPPCVRPDHLFEGTQKDNMQDAARKGRTNKPFGVISSRRKLTFEQAQEIREKYKTGNYTAYRLSKEYGIDEKGIVKIVRNQAYTK